MAAQVIFYLLKLLRRIDADDLHAQLYTAQADFTAPLAHELGTSVR